MYGWSAGNGRVPRASATRREFVAAYYLLESDTSILWYRKLAFSIFYDTIVRKWLEVRNSFVYDTPTYFVLLCSARPSNPSRHKISTRHKVRYPMFSVSSTDVTKDLSLICSGACHQVHQPLYYELLTRRGLNKEKSTGSRRQVPFYNSTGSCYVWEKSPSCNTVWAYNQKTLKITNPCLLQ